MPSEKIRALLTELQQEAAKTDLDEANQKIIRELDSKMQELATGSTDVSSLLELLETKFATNHPLIDRFLREMIDTLTKMGI